MNTDVILGIVLIVAIAAAIYTLKSLYDRIVSLLQQDNDAAVKEAFAKGWDACALASRKYMPETETTRVSRYLP